MGELGELGEAVRLTELPMSTRGRQSRTESFDKWREDRGREQRAPGVLSANGGGRAECYGHESGERE